MSSTPKLDFYIPEGYGFPYDIQIDNAIIEELHLVGTKTMSSGELKLTIERSLSRRISSSTYSEHLKRLESGMILKKHDFGRGKEIVYHLTKLAQIQIDLHLLNYPLEEIYLFRRIYGKILFYDIAYTIPLTVQREEEFYEILSKLNVNKVEVSWGRLSTADNHESVQIVYEKDRTGYKSIVDNYWKEREGQSTVLEEIEFISYPLIADSERRFELECKRVEYWQINKYSEHKKYRTEYLFKVSGFTIADILNNSSFKKEDVEKAIRLLIQIGLIRESFEFNGKRLYVIADKRFHDLLEELWGLHESEFSLLLYKWQFFDPPSEEERKRMIRLFGEQEARRILKQADRSRSEHNVMLRKCESLEKYNDYLKKDCSTDFQVLGYNSELEIYEQGRKKVPISKDEIRKDILRFVQYRKERLYRHLKNLPVNLEEEGIEEIKMSFSGVRDRYAFLYPIIRDICPRAFELPDYELQTRIMDDDLEKGKAEVSFFRKMGAIYRDKGRWHNLKSKNGKKIHYKMMKIYNPHTDRVERTKVLDFTNI
jgi:hypothetical protein